MRGSDRSKALRAGALLAVLVTAACEPRLPLAYLRMAAAPAQPVSLLERARDKGPSALLTDLPPPVVAGWDSIVASDTLTAILTFNSTGYFIHRGEPMGFEYEMLQAFAETHELHLRTVVARDRANLFRLLNRGEGDVVAARLTALEAYQPAVALTHSLYATSPVVVQRAVGSGGQGGAGPGTDEADDGPASAPAEGSPGGAPGKAEGPVRSPGEIPDTAIVDAPGDPVELPQPGEPVSLHARLLRRPSQLAGETLFVASASEYYGRITQVSDSIDGTIKLVEVAKTDQVEPLIEAVAEGRIRLTVSPENLARLSRARFTNIVATPVLGPEQPVAWAVRENAPELKRRLDAWLARPETRELSEQLYQKYFLDEEGYRERTSDEFLASATGRISRWDSLLAREASGLGWDWRLLAAQVAQESRFDPTARSWAGARGLLQLMPRTARAMGVTNPSDPEQNVRGGVKYLQRLSGLWADEISDETERRKFILASYNAGRGHVLDAQRLARKYGDDPTDWDDVAYWLLQLSKPSVYNDDVVAYGYVRGIQPVQYVSEILERYDSYRNIQ